MEALLSIAGSILGSLASKAAEYTVDPIAQQLSYLFKHRSKFQNLRTKVDQLKDARERVQQSVIDANRNGKGIFGDVDRWLTEVNGKISEQAATQLQEDEEKAMKRCFAGFCPNFKSRYQLSKKAEIEGNTIAELLNQKDRFDGVSHCPTLEGIGLRPVKEYEAFESRSGALNGVMEALKDDNCNIIGVYGMGGVGKTTLVKEVARQAKEKQLFDEVVFVAITQTSNPENIQNEIAEKLGQKFDVVSIDVRAARLRDRLKKDKKVLIILDDIWVTLDSYALGIPSRDEHMGCKILMTSRKLDVLQSMDSQKSIAIDILKDDEAWNLFKNIAGDIVERSDLQSIAIEVSQKCAGLPIAIATVAKALKHKENLFEWKNALRELRRPSERNFKGIPADAYSAIELSYKFLEFEEHRPIFLLCSIMGHNAAIEDLLRYGMGLGLFRDVYTMEETRDKVLTLVSNLKASCLLLDGSNQEHFDMHDVVRDVAISIASRDHQWLALGRDDEFKEWSDEEKMKNYCLISLRQYAKVSELLDHDQLGCPNLTFFSLSSEDSSLKIPDNFFLGMERLKVLDFTKMHFSSLPLSMGFLKNIHTLCLSKCMLKDIVVIGELRNLEILNLRKSDIAMLPREIGHLTKLKLLDLSDCQVLEVISPNVISSLSKLEELYLYGSFDRWMVEGIDDPLRSNASLVELQHLSHLTTLELHIPNVQAMPKDFLFSAKLKRYKISIGMEREWKCWEEKIETSRILKLKMNKSINLYDGVKTLLRNTESLYLDGVKDVMNMLYEPTTEGLPQIKHLHVSNVAEIKFMINSKELVSCKAFPFLESLCLDNLINLEAICYGQLKTGSFDRLRVINISRCKKLKNLFPFSTTRELRQLQEIELVFPAMEELKLHSISSIEKLWVWHDQLPIMSLGVQNLTSLSVWSCHKLKYVFISSMVKSLVQLKTLLVVQCDEMEEVIQGILGGDEEERNSSSIITVFPKLHYLKLRNLPNLKRFCRGINPIEFPFLKGLIIWDCHVLTTFHCDSTSVGNNNSSNISVDHNFNIHVPVSRYLFNQKVLLPMLEDLLLTSLKNLERLWPNQLAQDSFSKLICFLLEDCDKLLNVFPLSMLTRLQRLERLSIGRCKLLKEIIVGEDDDDDDDEVKDEITFPLLTSLTLSSVPKLESFCSSGDYTFGFPSLETVIVEDCPNMKMFSQGDSNTPMLHNVQLKLNDEDCWSWEGSLNSTIQQLFKERVFKDGKPKKRNKKENYKEDQGNPSISYTLNFEEESQILEKYEGPSCIIL